MVLPAMICLPHVAEDSPTGFRMSVETVRAFFATNAPDITVIESDKSSATVTLAAEARLLAAPVSTEVVSTAHAEGVEDRATFAPLAALLLVAVPAEFETTHA